MTTTPIFTPQMACFESSSVMNHFLPHCPWETQTALLLMDQKTQKIVQTWREQNPEQAQELYDIWSSKHCILCLPNTILFDGINLLPRATQNMLAQTCTLLNQYVFAQRLWTEKRIIQNYLKGIDWLLQLHLEAADSDPVKEYIQKHKNDLLDQTELKPITALDRLRSMKQQLHADYVKEIKTARRSLRPKFQDWVTQAPQGENRAKALTRMLSFLTNPKTNLLDLNDLGLSEVPPQLFTCAAFAQRLDNLGLGGNKITVIPTEIGRLTHLRLLGFNNNQITTIPTEISACSQLQKLNFAHNTIRATSAEIRSLSQLPQLRWLYLKNNAIRIIPTEIGLLTQLDQLFLANNHTRSYPQELRLLTQLRVLNLSDQRTTQDRLLAYCYAQPVTVSDIQTP